MQGWGLTTTDCVNDTSVTNKCNSPEPLPKFRRLKGTMAPDDGLAARKTKRIEQPMDGRSISEIRCSFCLYSHSNNSFHPSRSLTDGLTDFFPPQSTSYLIKKSPRREREGGGREGTCVGRSVCRIRGGFFHLSLSLASLNRTDHAA